MISLNRGNTLSRTLVEKHGFSAELAKGTLMIIDEVFDTGINRIVASLESKMDKRFDDLESKVDKNIAELRSDMNAQSQAVVKSLNHMTSWLPVKSMLYTLGGLAATVGITAGLAQIIELST